MPPRRKKQRSVVRTRLGEPEIVEEFKLFFSEYCTPILEYMLVPERFDEMNTNDVITWSDICDHFKRRGAKYSPSSSRIYEALECLRRAHCIRREGKGKKTCYKLTLPGMVTILTLRPKNWKYITRIANRHRELFPVFQSWPLFRRYGCIESVKGILQKVFEYGYWLCGEEWELGRKKYFPKRYWPESWALEKWEYVEKVPSKIKKLSKEEEQELIRDVDMNERELRRMLMGEFARGVLDSCRPLPRGPDPKFLRLLEALRSSPDLCQLLMKAMKWLLLHWEASLYSKQAVVAFLKGDMETFRALISKAWQTKVESSKAHMAFCKSCP